MRTWTARWRRPAQEDDWQDGPRRSDRRGGVDPRWKFLDRPRKFRGRPHSRARSSPWWSPAPSWRAPSKLKSRRRFVETGGQRRAARSEHFQLRRSLGGRLSRSWSSSPAFSARPCARQAASVSPSGVGALALLAGVFLPGHRSAPANRRRGRGGGECDGLRADSLCCAGVCRHMARQLKSLSCRLLQARRPIGRMKAVGMLIDHVARLIPYSRRARGAGGSCCGGPEQCCWASIECRAWKAHRAQFASRVKTI